MEWNILEIDQWISVKYWNTAVTYVYFKVFKVVRDIQRYPIEDRRLDSV